MKKLILSAAALLGIAVISCDPPPHKQPPGSATGSYELDIHSSDTINLIDLSGKKQGKWIIKNAAGSPTDTVYYKDGVAQ